VGSSHDLKYYTILEEADRNNNTYFLSMSHLIVNTIFNLKILFFYKFEGEHVRGNLDCLYQGTLTEGESSVRLNSSLKFGTSLYLEIDKITESCERGVYKSVGLWGHSEILD
jgi:hypothetical protein